MTTHPPDAGFGLVGLRSALAAASSPSTSRACVALVFLPSPSIVLLFESR